MRHTFMPRLDMTTPTELDAYALALYARRRQAVTVPVMTVTRAMIGNCHQNVTAFNTEHPGSTAVTGWLIMELSLQQGSWLYAHSVARTAARALVDVTPRADERYHLPFLIDTSAMFFKIRAAKIAYLVVPALRLDA